MTSTIVVREAGKSLPDDFAELVLSKYKACLGYAIGNQDDQVSSEKWSLAEYSGSEALAAVNEAYGKDVVCYQFVDGNATELNNDYTPPLSVLWTEDGKDLLVVMASGEFPKHNTNQDVPGEAAYVGEFLNDYIAEMWEACGNNIDALMNLLGKESRQQKLLEEAGPGTTLVFIPYKGAPKLISNVEHADYGGFSAPISLGYTKAAAKPEAPKTTLKLKPKTETETKIPADAGTKEDLNTTYKSILGKKFDGTFMVDGAKLWVRPPTGANLGKMRDWWNRNSSMPCPKEAEDVMQGFPADALRKGSSLYALRMKALGVQVDRNGNPVNQPKEAEQEQAPIKPEKEEKKPENPMISCQISAEKKKEYLRKKAEGRYPLCTVEDLQKSVNLYPPCHISLGENQSEMELFSPLALVRLDSHILAMWVHALRCDKLGLKPQSAEEQKPEEKPETVQPEKPADKPKLKLKLKAA